MQIENPIPGVYVYKNAITNNNLIPQNLEDIIEKYKDIPYFKWNTAKVGDNAQIIPEYRNCYDFKVADFDFTIPKRNKPELADLYNGCVSDINVALEDYCNKYNISMSYREAINFVKYGAGEHFSVHPDSGPGYSCQVSTVGYLNDDFIGGELYYPYFDYTYKPVAGDLVLFPSNFLYAHAAMPVKEGIKYSMVTMFDWNDKYHQE